MWYINMAIIISLFFRKCSRFSCRKSSLFWEYWLAPRWCWLLKNNNNWILRSTPRGILFFIRRTSNNSFLLSADIWLYVSWCLSWATTFLFSASEHLFGVVESIRYESRGSLFLFVLHVDTYSLNLSSNFKGGQDLFVLS